MCRVGRNNCHESAGDMCDKGAECNAPHFESLIRNTEKVILLDNRFPNHT